jgi:5'-nucleotidase
VLLSNDDGVRAPGLLALRDALLEIADVVTVAPEHEQSASSHALSLHRPLRFSEVAPDLYGVDGTPADCVYVALFSHRFLPRTPTIVVSGLNRGLNLASDVHYSGTVAAAREAALRGIRSIAFSADIDTDMHAAARLSRRIVTAVLEHQDHSALLLNVNFPAGKQWPLRVTRLGSRTYQDGVEIRQDPRGREYLWLGGPPGVTHDGENDTDTSAFDAGAVSITPLSLDPSNRGLSQRVESIVGSVKQVNE